MKRISARYISLLVLFEAVVSRFIAPDAKNRARLRAMK